MFNGNINWILEQTDLFTGPEKLSSIILNDSLNDNINWISPHKHRKNCECCPCHSLFKCKLWMLRLLLSIVRNVISVSKVTSCSDWSLRVFSNCNCHCLFWKCHVSSPVWSNVSKVTSLWDSSLRVFAKCLCNCLFFGQVVSPHHSD